VHPPEVLEHQDDGHHTRLWIRYQFSGTVSGTVRAVVDPAKLTWVSELTVDPKAATVEFQLHPDHYPDRLDCSGSYVFRARGRSTDELITGRLTVHYPVVGRSIERVIFGGIQEHFAEEAALAALWHPSAR
jgi:hypothetical protein